jgi:integrase
MSRKAKPFFWRGGWYTDAGGCRRLLARGRENRKQAQAALEELLRERVRRGAAPEAPAIGLKELIDRFAESLPADAPPETVEYYRACLGRLAQRFGNRRASGLTGQEAALWQKKLAREYAPNTVNHTTACAGRLFKWAIDEAGLIPGPNPFAKVKALDVRLRERLMSREEYRRLHDSSPPALRDVLVALRYTSARPGEVRALEWRMVDWGRKLWVLPAHKTIRTSRAKAPRVIAFPPEVEEVMRRRLAASGGGPGDRVFLTARGRPWSKRRLGELFALARRKAGLEGKRGERLVLYTTRHTILTEAVRSGVTGPQLQALGGWTSLAMARRYVHLDEADVYRIGMRAAEAVRSQGGAPGTPGHTP